jgi:RNA polymerase sigma-70 factor (ECF subfamily)
MMYQKSSATPEDHVTDKLYQKYAATIFTYVRQHARTREDAEDILVDTFLAALEESRFRLLSEKEQVSWLWRVARNKVIDAYRRASVRHHVPLDDIAETVLDGEESMPEWVALRSEEEQQVRDLLKRLSPSHQEVMQLRFGHGLRSVEIASVVGKSEAAVRTMLSRAMNLLRNISKEQEGERAQ